MDPLAAGTCRTAGSDQFPGRRIPAGYGPEWLYHKCV